MGQVGLWSHWSAQSDWNQDIRACVNSVFTGHLIRVTGFWPAAICGHFPRVHLFCKKYALGNRALFKTLVDCDIVILSKFLQQIGISSQTIGIQQSSTMEWQFSTLRWGVVDPLLFISQVDAVKYHLSVGLCWFTLGFCRRLEDPIISLVGGLEHDVFFIIYGRIIPTDFHIFQRGRSTTNQNQIECFENRVPSTLSIQS